MVSPRKILDNLNTFGDPRTGRPVSREVAELFGRNGISLSTVVPNGQEATWLGTEAGRAYLEARKGYEVARIATAEGLAPADEAVMQRVEAYLEAAARALGVYRSSVPALTDFDRFFPTTTFDQLVSGDIIKNFPGDEFKKSIITFG